MPAKSIVFTPRVCWKGTESEARGLAIAQALATFAAATNVRRCTVGVANRLRELRRALAALWEAIDVRLRTVNCVGKLVR